MPKVLKDFKVLKDCRVFKVYKDYKELKVCKVFKELLEF